MSRAPSSRIVAVHLEALPLEVVFADAPVEGERAVAIRELSRGRATLVAVSEAALAAGVVPGMSEAEGRATHGELVVREREPALELIRLERAAELLFAYGPEVEVCPPSTLFVEIGRSRPALRRRFGSGVSEGEVLEHLLADLKRVGHRATAALADDPDTARTFAEHLAGRLRPPPTSSPRAKSKKTAKRERSGASAGARGDAGGAARARRGGHAVELAPAGHRGAARRDSGARVNGSAGEVAPASGHGDGGQARRDSGARVNGSAGEVAPASGRGGQARRDSGARVNGSAGEVAPASDRGGQARRDSGARCASGSGEAARARGRDEGAPAGEGGASRWEVVPPGGARRALARLPVFALTWTDRASDPEGRLRRRLHAAAEALRVLGIRDVRGLHGLPAAELGSRFGEAGTCLAERAAGQRRRPLRRHVPPERLEEDYELEAATDALEPVLFVLRRLFVRLAARLSARQRAASGLTLDFLVEPGLERRIALDEARSASSKRREAMPVRFARPTRDADAMLAIAREKLGGALPGAVLAVRVVAEQPESDRGAQLDLFSRRTQRAEALGELVGRLGAALGDAAVFSPSLADTHRPEEGWTRTPFRVDAALAPARPPPRASAPSFMPRVVAGAGPDERALPAVDAGFSVVQPALEPDPDGEAPGEAWPKPCPRRAEDEPPPPLPPRPLELLDPPEPATFHEGRRVLAWRGRRHPVRELSGREHLRTEWWRPDPLERDYLTVETEEGRGLWVYVTPKGATYVHGLFD